MKKKKLVMILIAIILICGFIICAVSFSKNKEAASRKSESQQAPFKQEKTEEQNEDVKENQNKNQDVSDNDEDIEEDGEGKSTEDTTENLDNKMEIPEEWNE